MDIETVALRQDMRPNNNTYCITAKIFKASLLLSLYVRQMKKILMKRLSVCSLGVSCNGMIDTPMLLVVHLNTLVLIVCKYY